MNKIYYTLLAMTSVVFLACGGSDHSTESTETEAVEESHDGHDHADMEESAELALLPIPEGAKVIFSNLNDGDKVTSPLVVDKGSEGINVHPAGELIEGKVHHHIIVDCTASALGEVVPADETHIHFGGGQTETELVLTPGSHTLSLQFADGLHRSYGEALSATITIEVEAAE